MKNKHFIFICEKKRDGGSCCGSKGIALRSYTKKLIEISGFKSKLRAVKSGCMDFCSEGPVLYDGKSQKIFKKVSRQDVKKLIESYV